MTERGDDAAAVCTDLLTRMRSLQLSTVDNDGTPHCGYTPYLYRSPDFYVFVSHLSAHTRDMDSTGRAAMMVIDDEQNSPQIFARIRASFQCEATSCSTGDDETERLLDAYQERHGKMAGLLRQLPDFRLVRLTPVSGQFVMGFGQAYRVSGKLMDRFEHTRTG